jgi:hypothetical protein
MPVSLFPDFVPVAPVTNETIARYQSRLEPAVIELWQQQGYGIAADGFIKVVDPDRYLTMVGGCFPREEMVPVFATGMGDVIVAYKDGYRVLEFRYATVAGLGSSIRHLAVKAGNASWLDEMLAHKPYAQVSRARGTLTTAADYDYIYGYKLPLPAGGPEDLENLDRVRIFEHIAIIDQLAGRIPFIG